MNRIFEKNPFNLIEWLKNNRLFQIDYKNAYVKRIDNNIFYYSYDTCILQIDMTTKTIYKNIKKYSRTTSKQLSQILHEIPLNYFNIVDVIPVHQKYGYYYDLRLEKLN